MKRPKVLEIRLYSTVQNSKKDLENLKTNQDFTIRHLKFKLSRSQAREVHDRYHFEKLFGPKLSHFQNINVKKVYLPFYAAKCDTLNNLEAWLDFNQPTCFQYSSNEDSRKLHLVRHCIHSSFDGTSGLKWAQFYASYAYDRSIINQLKGWLLGLDDEEIKNESVELSNEDDIDYIAFSVPPVTILRKFLEPKIRQLENTRARQFLRHRYPKATVDDYRIFLQHPFIKLQAVYYPCFIFLNRYRDEPFFTYVSGLNGQVLGQRFLNERKIGALSSLFSSTIASMWIPSTAKALSFWALKWVAFPYMATTLAARLFPILKKNFSDTRNILDEGFDSKTLSHYDPQKSPLWWDIKSVGKRYEEWLERETLNAQSEDWNNQSQFNQSAYFNSERVLHPDPLGYYAVLGFSGKESQPSSKDIRAAFRRIAKEYHPDSKIADSKTQEDVYLQESLAIDPSERFQKASQAYYVLGNPKKRKYYDKYGKIGSFEESE